MLVLDGSLSAAVGLGTAMTLAQFAIGAVNDIADAALDARAQPFKPIPAGLVSLGWARLVAVAAGLGAVVIAAASGPLASVVLLLIGLGTGLLYDLRSRGTAWSWLPFALGVALLVAYAAVGAGAAGGGASVVVLVALALPAGAGLAIANALPDVVGDLAVGRGSVASRLGPRLAWPLGAALVLGSGGLLALGILARPGADPPETDPRGTAAVALALVGMGLVLLGVLLGRAAGTPGLAGRSSRPSWEAQGVGVALVALAWLLVRPLDG